MLPPPQTLADQMAARILSNIQEKHPDAVATQFQKELALACATAFIKTVQGAEAFGVGGPAAGVGAGIAGVDPGFMSQVATTSMGDKVGESLPDLLDGIFTPASQALLAVTVVPTTGFGGQTGGITGFAAHGISMLIIDALPNQTQQMLLSSEAGMDLVDAIASGFAEGLYTGVPGFIPFGPGTPGGTIATFQ